jgi:hypothetical protein
MSIQRYTVSEQSKVKIRLSLSNLYKSHTNYRHVKATTVYDVLSLQIIKIQGQSVYERTFCSISVIKQALIICKINTYCVIMQELYHLNA